ncbi:bifunctional glycosyltransferase/CDP-glycerol:glycerophosphate glycerophosphotransferase [Leucobacter sp. HY1910]
MSIRTKLVDKLSSPELLPLREKVRMTKRRALGTVARGRRMMTRGSVPGLLSIVVPMYGVERYIGECLESLQKQNYPNVQIVVVDDGSPDRSYEVARSYAKWDPRIEIVRRKNGGLSAARNTGIEHARGEYLAFLDSDDFVDRHAYQDAIESLTRTGSDFAVMPYRRERNGSFPPAGEWVRAAHAGRRDAVSLAEFPDIMVNAVAWSKVYRREFWVEHGFEFPEGLLYEDQAVSMAAYAAARTFDVLPRTSINWRIRNDQTSISQQLVNPRNIAHHLIAVRDSIEQLERFGATDACDVRILQNLNNNLGEFLPNIFQMGDDAWREFVEFLTYLSDQTTDDMWRQIEVRKKVLVGLIVRGERDLAERFLTERGWHRDLFGGALQGDSIIADVPLREELAQVLPEMAFVYSVQETQLHAVWRRVRAADSAAAGSAAGAQNDVEIDLFAHVNHLPIDRVDNQLEVSLVAPDGTATPLQVTRRKSHLDARSNTRRYADMSTGAATVHVPHALLAASGDYELRATMTAGALTRTATVTLDDRSEFSVAAQLDTDRLFAPVGRADEKAQLRVWRPAVRVASAVCERGSVQLTLTSDLDVKQVALERVDDRLRAQREATAVAGNRSTGYSATIALPSAERGPVEYLLVAVDSRGTKHYPTLPGAALSIAQPNAQPGAQSGAQPGDKPGARSSTYVHVAAQLHTTPAEFLLRRQQLAEQPGKASESLLFQQEPGRTLIVDARGGALVTGVDVTEDEILLAVQLPAGAAKLVGGTARSGSFEHSLKIVEHGEGLAVAMPLRANAWGLGTTGLKRGEYRLMARDVDGNRVRLYLAHELAQQLPVRALTSTVRVSLERSPRDLLRVHIDPPHADDEIGWGDRWRLRDHFATLRPASDSKTVLFRNRYGEDANDSALAVHNELVKRGADLDLVWAVRDASVRVPEGARTVLEESREYYEAFGTAKYVMVNVHQPEWYVKPEGQVLIQTHHGYPFKLQGRRWWQKLGDTAERQESLFRRADEWDYLVSPAKYATAPLLEFYRSSEGVPSEVLEIGYPRNDALLDAQASKLRDETRARLGIGDDKRVILYAPTYRDYLSADQMSPVAMPEFLDFAQLSDELGPDYVILMRGHPFNAQSETRHNSAFINVTDYHDINHLILASDMAILDYSSLRFDYALTGKPALFFVSDRERYFAGRESFVPYDDTVSGPQITDQGELTRQIRRADDVAREYEPVRQRFIAEFMEQEDGHAAARLVDIVFASRGDAGGAPESVSTEGLE